ncbi:hypothetical protein QQX98_001463 [Neonectria punicea]|uniref:Zn(2)-C6 fungal-type domain-containing protein n=1 Tax=Neonectria punicea TaxID=979145 RepID=A0ABR1HP82_9HYPO
MLTILKLKCDETKPGCQMCSRKGWACGGYQREFRWSYKHEQKTKGGARGKGRAGARTGKEQASRAAGAPARSKTQIPGVSEFSLDTMSMDMAPNPLPYELPVTNPFLGSIDYGWDNDDPSDIAAQPDMVAPPHDVAGWNPQSSSANLIVPVTMDQLDESEFLEVEDIEVLPEPPADLTLTTTRDNQQYSTHVPPSITHVPSVLITQWFKSVCTVWSAYDSDMNLNRILATSLWSESEAVSACLQSMSASFLATRIPYMRQTSLTMMKTATKAIHNELAVARNVTYVNSIPTGLLFSLFCIGTTLCWIDAGQLGIPFLRAAKSMLDQVNQQQPDLCDEDYKLLNFFNKSWVYCDMLLSVVSYEDSQYGVGAIEEVHEAPATPNVEPKRADDIPHPWTGISTTASALFTRAIRLCRSFRHNVGKQAPTTDDIEMVLKQMEEAPVIEEQLLQLEYDSEVPLSETGDQHTPCVHLVKVAEAYRIAALLHLYQTFPDLVALRIPERSSASRRGPVPWEDWIVPLSLRLIDILEQLPPESGSRMVQPLLCITASTGLRLDIPAGSWSSGNWGEKAPASQEISIGAYQENCDIAEFMSQLSDVEHTTHPPNMPTQLSIDVGNARAFVLKRLNMLENTLPPKPIIMAKKLVQAIWVAYDNEMPGCNAVHWVDVMEAQNLRSIFG